MFSHSVRTIPQIGFRGWQAAERTFDAAFGSALNPLRHLGTIGFLALWLLVGSGVILYALFDTSVDGAWRSIERLAHWPLGTGHLLRGLHHYAADLLILAVLLHILREWLHGHHHGVRRFHWLTGVPLLIFCFISAIGGFWLAWDQLGLYSALSTAQWLDGLPLLASPLARNFLSASAVSDRLFSLFIFIHVGVPLLLVFGLWFHVQRLTHVSMLPPRRLAVGIIAVLAGLALVRPVLSAAPAALDHMPAALNPDWLLLWLHPLTDATSRGFTLALVGTAVLVLFALPFLSHRPRAAIAVVNPEHCSGCGYCFADCPYAAVTMVPHPGQHPGHWLARVDADLCIGCGICAGACPSSTPFRTLVPLASGIDMPQLSVNTLKTRLQKALTTQSMSRTVVVFSCKHGVPAPRPNDPDLHVFELLCAGQLPPSFIEYALRMDAAGVVVAACREGSCEFRLGEQWIAQRLAGQRHPSLRTQARAAPIQLIFAGPHDGRALDKAILEMRDQAMIM